MSEKFKEWFKTFSIPTSGIIHAGAHLGQEMHVYKSLGLNEIVWIEANPNIFFQLKKLISNESNQRAIQACLWSKNDFEVEFNIAGNQESSSSILEPYLISASHPEVLLKKKIILKTRTLDSIVFPDLVAKKESDYRILVLDVQGAELEVLKGAERFLSEIDSVFLELSNRKLYKGNSSIKKITEFMRQREFSFVASEIDLGTGWGEGLFISNKLVKNNYINIEKENHIYKGKKINLGTLLRSYLIKLGIPAKVVTKLKKI